MTQPTERIRFVVVHRDGEKVEVCDTETGITHPAPDEPTAERAADIANRADAEMKRQQLAGAKRLLKDVFHRR